VYSIGIVAGVPQPIAAAENLRNLPEKGVFNWEPGAQFGIYRPDTFWFEDGAGG
jgi:peptide/nickel transport system substrate-binding protein